MLLYYMYVLAKVMQTLSNYDTYIDSNIATFRKVIGLEDIMVPESSMPDLLWL